MVELRKRFKMMSGRPSAEKFGFGVTEERNHIYTFG